MSYLYASDFPNYLTCLKKSYTVVYTWENCTTNYLSTLILLQACVPYFDILEQWIYKGIISDPYSEVYIIKMTYY